MYEHHYINNAPMPDDLACYETLTTHYDNEPTPEELMEILSNG